MSKKHKIFFFEESFFPSFKSVFFFRNYIYIYFMDLFPELKQIFRGKQKNYLPSEFHIFFFFLSIEKHSFC